MTSRMIGDFRVRCSVAREDDQGYACRYGPAGSAVPRRKNAGLCPDRRRSRICRKRNKRACSCSRASMACVSTVNRSLLMRPHMAGGGRRAHARRWIDLVQEAPRWADGGANRHRSNRPCWPEKPVQPRWRDGMPSRAPDMPSLPRHRPAAKKKATRESGLCIFSLAGGLSRGRRVHGRDSGHARGRGHGNTRGHNNDRHRRDNRRARDKPPEAPRRPARGGNKPAEAAARRRVGAPRTPARDRSRPARRWKCRRPLGPRRRLRSADPRHRHQR